MDLTIKRFCTRNEGRFSGTALHDSKDDRGIQIVVVRVEKGSLNLVSGSVLNANVMERFGLVRNEKEQIVSGIYVYLEDYFKQMDSVTGKPTKIENTYTIH